LKRPRRGGGREWAQKKDSMYFGKGNAEGRGGRHNQEGGGVTGVGGRAGAYHKLTKRGRYLAQSGRLVKKGVDLYTAVQKEGETTRKRPPTSCRARRTRQWTEPSNKRSAQRKGKSIN